MPKLAAVKAQQNRVKRRELTSDSIAAMRGSTVVI